PPYKSLDVPRWLGVTALDRVQTAAPMLYSALKSVAPLAALGCGGASAVGTRASFEEALMPDQQYILVDLEAPIAVVTINRAEKLNALNWTVVAELASRLEELDRDESIRCIVLTGAGNKAFAAGADIAEMSGKGAVDML